MEPAMNNSSDAARDRKLCTACQFENKSTVLQLLQQGANPNSEEARDWCGKTPLHYACQYGWLDVIQQLVEDYKCDPQIRIEGAIETNYYKSQVTPLHTACENGNDEAVRLLVEKYQCNPNVTDYTKQTPLHYVCSHGEVGTKIARRLIAHGADPNATDSFGNTPLHTACLTENVEIVRCLVEVTKCNPNIRNVDGFTALQVNLNSRMFFNSEIIKELVAHNANPNLAYNDGNTPLHRACQAERLEVVDCLLAEKECDPNAKNKDGLTPLQVTSLNCLNSKAMHIISELIAHGANPNVADSTGNTPLHKACQTENLEVVQCLLTVIECDPNAKNNDGLTPLQVTSFNYLKGMHIVKELIAHGANPGVTDSDGNTPLHKACQAENLSVVNCLLTATKECDPNVKNKDGLTPLQLTSLNYWGAIYIVEELITHGANPNVVDSDGSTPLHKACQVENEELVKCLLTSKECDPNAANRAGLTPLQVASFKHSGIIQALITHGAISNVVDSDGNTPLHKACLAGNVESVKCLLTTKECDPNAINRAGLIPLQVTSFKSSDIIQALTFCGTVCNVVDSDGNTPLHKACQEFNLDAVKCLAPNCNPDTKNNDGLTPLKIASTRNTTVAIAIIKELLRHGAHANDVYKHHGKSLKRPLQPPIKVFVVGDPLVGKSTLTAALQKESSFFGRVFTTRQKITVQDERTAGIVPHDFESKEYGYTTFYDFAGQREFYGSHAAVLNSTICSFPPIFLVVVDLGKSEDDIVKTILYWLTFLENQCSTVTDKPHIICVGSHADVLKERGEDIVSKSESVKASITTIMLSKFVFAGFIAMDCQYSESRGMTELRQCLKTSCNTLRARETITFNAHCFFVYLLDKFRDSFAVTVEQIQEQIETDLTEVTIDNTVTSFVPTSLNLVCKICDELNDRGHILFLKESHDIEQSWVVVDKNYLLEQVNGSIFAPENFKQHKAITQCKCSTGVVPLSSISGSFPEHNSELLIKFLSCLEFCSEISDPEILHRITIDHQTCLVNKPQKGTTERYFIFPALVSLSVPTNIWDDKPEYKHHFGWLLCCSSERPGHFFSSRFLQVLILRMAATHPFPLSEEDKFQSNPSIQRNCSIWKNGIFWANGHGVETLVEVLPDNKAVMILMRCEEDVIVEMAHLRSQVICQVLKAAEELCSAITTNESFIDPSDCKQYSKCKQYDPLKPTSQLKLYSVSSTCKAIATSDSRVVSPTGAILIEKLLPCEPYANLCTVDVLWDIFAENRSDDLEVVSSEVFLQFTKKDKKLFNKVFSSDHKSHTTTQSHTTSQDTLSVFRSWKTECAGTYKNLREKFDEFSVFAGRNLVSLAGDIERQNQKITSVKPYKPSTEGGEQPVDETDLSLIIVEAIPQRSDKPTLQQLQALSCDGKTFKIIEHTAGIWWQLATTLGFEGHIIQYLSKDFHGDSIGATTEVLTKWLNGESNLDQPITWDTLIQCLGSVGKIVLVEDLTKALRDD